MGNNGGEEKWGREDGSDVESADRLAQRETELRGGRTLHRTIHAIHTRV